LSVFAIDGSKYTLPATEELRTVFHPKSGLQHPGKGHYPQCLVSTVVDVFRRRPLARTIVAIAQADERKQALALLPVVPPAGIILFDQGYPGFDLIDALRRQYAGFWVIRCPASGTFPAVEAFAQSGQTEAVVTLTRALRSPISLRAIRLLSPEGKVSVLLTNLPSESRFDASQIITLYFRRWAVETHYRDEKTCLGIETFHSRTENGIRQELFAVLIVAVISRVLSVMTVDPNHPSKAESQLKHAIITTAQQASILIPCNPERALLLFRSALAEIKRVLYYPPKKPRPPQPRVSKRPSNKWQEHKTRRAYGQAGA